MSWLIYSEEAKNEKERVLILENLSPKDLYMNNYPDPKNPYPEGVE